MIFKKSMLLGVVLCGCVIFASCQERQPQDIRGYFDTTEQIYTKLMEYSNNLVRTYTLTSDAEDTITPREFQIYVGMSTKEINKAIEELVGAKEIKKLPAYEINKSLFEYYEIDSITSYYFWIHENDQPDACLDIVREANKQSKTFESLEKLFAKAEKKALILSGNDKNTATTYLATLRKLYEYCQKPTGAENGKELRKQAQTNREIVAEAAKNTCLENAKERSDNKDRNAISENGVE